MLGGLSATNIDLLVIIVAAAAVAMVSVANRPRPGALALTAFATLLIVWVGGHLLAHLTDLVWLFRRLRWIGIATVPFIWFVFVLEYTGREDVLSWSRLGVLFAWPVAVNGLIWLEVVTPLAGFALQIDIWMGIYETSSQLFWAHLVISYGLFAVGSILLVDFIRRAHDTFRRQAVVVLLGVTALWIGSLVTVLELFGDLHYHALPAGLTVTALAFLWATTRGRLTHLVPVATSTVLRTIDVGVLVVDRDDRVVELNETARETFGLDPGASVVGHPIESVLADSPAGLEAITAAAGSGERTGSTAEIDGRIVQVRSSRLESGRGRVFVCDDVTDRERRRAELARQNESLERFAAVVSHDLRNPLTVAGGQLGLARDDCDSDHIDRVRDALDRMETIIDGTLTMARAGQTLDDESVEAVSMSATIEDAWRSIDSGEATLEVTGELTFAADRARLRHLVENLLANAVEHGGDAVTVRVGPFGDDGFFIEDDGPGFPDGQAGDLFEPGVGTAGPGLGLSIVSEVAEAHGWTISATASSAGGARVEVTDVETDVS